MKKIIFLLLPLICGANWQRVTVNKYKCENIRIIDGDTFKTNINIPEFQVILVNQTIRVWAFDAPELSKQRNSNTSNEEIKMGMAAKVFFQSLTTKYEIYVSPQIHARDPYGRFLCSIWLTSKDHNGEFINFSDLMIENNFKR